jgi:hypothetical protein
MLVDFKIRNYRSFADEQTLSLVASSDPLRPGNLIKTGKHSLLKSVALYGPNASGKSNLIKGISFMDQFIETSASGSNLGDPIKGVAPFRLDSKYALEPSSLETSLIIDETRYLYGFSASPTRVVGEWLQVAAPGGRMSHWLSRHYDNSSQRMVWAIKGPLRKYDELLSQRTRENGLMLSRAADLNIQEVSELYLWFKKKLQIIDLSVAPFLLVQKTAKRVSTDPEFKARALDLIRDADLGIDDFKVRESDVLVPPKDAPEEVAGLLKGVRIFLENVQHDPNIYLVSTLHQMGGGGSPVAFSLDSEESNGTQRLFALAGPILDALDQGTALVLDELECSIHPLLARKIIELFQSPHVNKKGAQLIFATHDSTLMSRDLFRRDQIWLTSKTSSGATELYSLYDIEDRPRNTEAIQKNYLDGRYGGVPRFGPIFEDLAFHES